MDSTTPRIHHPLIPPDCFLGCLSRLLRQWEILQTVAPEAVEGWRHLKYLFPFGPNSLFFPYSLQLDWFSEGGRQGVAFLAVVGAFWW